MRAFVVIVVVVLTSVVAGCGSDSSREAPAGVIIIASDAPVWSAGQSWRLADDPALSIGVDAGEEPYMFYWLRGVLMLDDGRIVVSDAGAHEVRFFDGNGAFILKTGRRGQGPGEYGEPATMALFGPTPSGHIVVSDLINGRLNVLDLQGDYVTQLVLGRVSGASGGGVVGLFGDGSWLGMATDGDNRLTGDPGTIIQMRQQWRRFSEEGQPMELLTYTDVRPRFVNETNGITNFPYVPFSADEQATPAGDRLWVMTADEPQVWAVDFEGHEVRRVRWRLADRTRSADVWERYVEESLAGIDSERRRMQYRHLYQQDLPMTEYVPVYREMIADELGNLWLERYRLPWETQPRWDVVDPERGWLGVVETPPQFQVFQITAEAVVGVQRDDAGVARVQVLELLK